eukprot:g38116.t1
MFVVFLLKVSAFASKNATLAKLTKTIIVPSCQQEIKINWMKRNVTDHTHGKISKSCRIPCRFRHSKAGENATWRRTPTCNADSISTTTLDFPYLTQFWNFTDQFALKATTDSTLRRVQKVVFGLATSPEKRHSPSFSKMSVFISFYNFKSLRVCAEKVSEMHNLAGTRTYFFQLAQKISQSSILSFCQQPHNLIASFSSFKLGFTTSKNLY